MKEIKLERRYPDSRDEDITDAFARGYSEGYSAGLAVGRKAVQTVIRSRTLMSTKDFKEWAKRVKEENQNVIVIPCDAEVAEPKHGEWEFKTIFPNDDSEFPMGYLKCSVCGSNYPNTVPNNYCPNCGAKMGGGAV